MARFWCIIWAFTCNFAISVWSSSNVTYIAASYKYFWIQFAPKITHQKYSHNFTAVLLQQNQFYSFGPSCLRRSSSVTLWTFSDVIKIFHRDRNSSNVLIGDYQCDQMARLFIHWLFTTIYLPNSKNCQLKLIFCKR